LMGLIALSIPWLFAGAGPVVVLTGVFVMLLIGIRVLPTLRIHLGSPIHGVDRKSLGEIYFVVAVGGLFLFSSGDPLLFCIPMLILTFADVAAGVAGLYCGSLRFRTVAGEKSIEGSFAFFLTAFLCTHTALLLFTEMGRGETLLSALAMGLFLTLVEAVAGNGLDNLLIPLVAFLLLKTYLRMNLITLAAHLGTAVVITAFALFWFQRRLAGRLDPYLSRVLIIALSLGFCMPVKTEAGPASEGGTTFNLVLARTPLASQLKFDEPLGSITLRSNTSPPSVLLAGDIAIIRKGHCIRTLLPESGLELHV
jgi:dolichol kinase